MILSIRANNYLVYSDEVELSLRADMKIKRMVTNTVPVGDLNVLKSVGVYGANNVGKTCLIRAIQSIKNVLLSFAAEVPANLFTGNYICSLGITFTEGVRIFSYDFKFNSGRNNGISPGFVYEKFSERKVDVYGNEAYTTIFLKDAIKQEYSFPKDRAVEELMKSIAVNNILIYTINTEKYASVNEIKNILRNCAEKIEIIDLNNIPLEKTIQLLKDETADKSKVVELIKHADLDVEDYHYVKPDVINFPVQPIQGVPQEVVLRAQTLATDMCCLMSNHRGKEVPSLVYDSTGTKKIAALASYIIEALEEGKILVVDELDSSLHFKLTRAIVSLFNNELNNAGAQLIFTVHDITLLDCKKLFRKDQIWFAAKENGLAYLYSLDDFTAQDGVRAENDIAALYRKGVLGAVPEPDLISVMLQEAK